MLPCYFTQDISTFIGVLFSYDSQITSGHRHLDKGRDATIVDVSSIGSCWGRQAQGTGKVAIIISGQWHGLNHHLDPKDGTLKSTSTASSSEQLTQTSLFNNNKVAHHTRHVVQRHTYQYRTSSINIKSAD